MQWYRKTLQAAFEGASINITTGLYAAFTSGADPDTGDAGHEFMSDFKGAGASVHTEAELDQATWSDRVLNHPDGVTIPDPGPPGAATHVVIYIKAGSDDESRLVCAGEIDQLTFDGTDDTLNFHANGIAAITA